MRRPTETGLHTAERDSSGAPLLADDIVAFLESGLSIILGVVGADGRARTGRALAVRVTEGGVIRILYPGEGNGAVTDTARTGGRIAATFSAPLSHRTLQIKGGPCRVEEIAPEDLAAAERQADAFAGILAALGYTTPFVQAICDYQSAGLCALSFPAEAAFEQTPGPGAGRSI